MEARNLDKEKIQFSYVQICPVLAGSPTILSPEQERKEAKEKKIGGKKIWKEEIKVHIHIDSKFPALPSSGTSNILSAEGGKYRE